MAANLLTVRQVEAAAPKSAPYWMRDGSNLYLYVTPTGSRLWRYRYRIGVVAGVYAIGRYPDLGLREARAARDEARKLVQAGIHPLAERQARLDRQLAANEHTVAAVFQRWMAANTQWTPYYRQQVERYIAGDILPHLGRIPVSRVQASHLRPLLLAVAQRGAPNAAILIRQCLSQAFNYAAVQGWCEHNPAAPLKSLIKRPPVQHHQPLGWQELPQFLHKADAWRGDARTKLALRLMALTFVRTVELRRARWEHIDLKGATWSIPAELMKMRRPHIVPLSRQAVAVLKQLHRLAGRSPYVLPNTRRPLDAPIGPSTLNRAIDALGYAGRFSAHGFRATATTLLGLLSYPENRVDLQLAHARTDQSRAPYDHTKYISSRRALMQDWADIVTALEQGETLEQVTARFGPLSRRRKALLRVVEHEQ